MLAQPPSPPRAYHSGVPTVIEAAALTKHYGAVRALQALDLAVEQGEVFGYLGPNGAGKSTTIRLLLDFIRPTAGGVRVFGLDARRGGIAIRRRTGYLSGDLSLYPTMTGRELLVYAAHLRGGAGIDPAYVGHLLDRFDADPTVPLRELSRGNRQKIGIVHAFMHRPDLLVLDEPSTGLDPLMQQEFYRLLHETTAEGRTVFISSHILPEVDQVADRVGIIRKGVLEAVEEPAVLKQRAGRLVEARFGGAGAAAEAAERLGRLPGVSDVSLKDGALACRIEGSMDAFVKTLALYEVEELTTREASLEDVFLGYYEREARSGDANVA